MLIAQKAHSIVLPKTNTSKLTLAFIASIVIAIAAQISIPLQPIPITLQTLAVFAIAFSLGANTAVLAVLFYLIEGALGLPVFANFHGGLPVLLGPTAGYLFGFLPAVWVAGFLMEQSWCKNRLLIILAVIISSLFVFIPGVFVLSRFIGTQNAWAFGVVPFYGIFITKLIVFALLVPTLWQKNNKT